MGVQSPEDRLIAAGASVSTAAAPLQPKLSPDGRGSLPLVYFSDIKPSLEALDFVEGVITEGSAGVIYGESNTGKTFWATDLALHVAAGLQWRDREVDQGGVIYVALEGGMGFQNRIEAWRLSHPNVRNVAFAAIMMQINMLNPEADTERLIEAVFTAGAAFEQPVKLVVIDTLSRAMAGGDENGPSDMGALVTNMDRVRGATKAAVWFIHHSGKDAAKGARGHSLLRAAIDTEVEVTVLEKGPNAARAAKVVKQRDLSSDDAFPFSLRVIELGTNRRGKPVTSCVIEIQGTDHPALASNATKLKGHSRRAMDALHDLLAEQGQSGHKGVPDGFLSVQAEVWRQRFYDRSLSTGAELKQDSKRAAFNRASDDLSNRRLIGVACDQVWSSRPVASDQT